MSFKKFLLEMEDEKSKYATYDPKKNYKNERFAPFSASETAKGLKALDALPRAQPNRRGFNTENEIDCRDLGFLWGGNTKLKQLSWGQGRAFGVAQIPINKMVAAQPSITVPGIEAYLHNKKLYLPVIVQYPGVDEFCVAAGHTRIAAQHLAGRTPKVLLIWEPDEWSGKGRRPVLNWEQ